MAYDTIFTLTTELIDAAHALVSACLASGQTEETMPALGRTQRALLALMPVPTPVPEKRVRVDSKWRNLNSKMRGEEGYTLAISGDHVCWIDQHPNAIVVSRGMQPRGIRASERRCQDVCEVPVGTIVIYIIKNEGNTRYAAGRIQEDKEKPGQGCLYADDGIKHVGIRHEGTTFVHIIEINGVRHTFTTT